MLHKNPARILKGVTYWILHLLEPQKYYKAICERGTMVFGVDIGGTAIKITQLLPGNKRFAVKFESLPFLTKEEMISCLISSVTNFDSVVITQTVCANRKLFSTAKEGTHYVIDVTKNLFGEKVRYLGLSYKLYLSKEAKEQYLQVACRNWVATCYLASSLSLFEDGLVVDCGTNSTDIVPVINGYPVTLEDNDRGYTRFKTGELVWSGLLFTPIPSLASVIVLDGEAFPVKPAIRTRSYHVYTVLGLISSDIIAAYEPWQPKKASSFESSAERMLDLIAADRELLSVSDAKKIAAFLAEKQVEKTKKALKKVLSTVKRKYTIDIKTAGVAGIGKDIILQKALEPFDMEIVDIKKVVSEAMGTQGLVLQENCESSLGCALIGLEHARNPGTQ
jgi:probable H4MPT-linked C1 transfer pathway protein